MHDVSAADDGHDGFALVVVAILRLDDDVTTHNQSGRASRMSRRGLFCLFDFLTETFSI